MMSFAHYAVILGARAMSEEKFAAHDRAMLALVGQAAPSSLEQIIAATNYRPPAYVPIGWQDWYSCGDQLH